MATSQFCWIRSPSYLSVPLKLGQHPHISSYIPHVCWFRSLDPHFWCSKYLFFHFLTAPKYWNKSYLQDILQVYCPHFRSLKSPNETFGIGQALWHKAHLRILHVAKMRWFQPCRGRSGHIARLVWIYHTYLLYIAIWYWEIYIYIHIIYIYNDIYIMIYIYWYIYIMIYI